MPQLPELQTPALLVDAELLDHNLRTMAAARPGASLRPQRFTELSPFGPPLQAIQTL